MSPLLHAFNQLNKPNHMIDAPRYMNADGTQKEMRNKGEATRERFKNLLADNVMMEYNVGSAAKAIEFQDWGRSKIHIEALRADGYLIARIGIDRKVYYRLNPNIKGE